ncbi:hypothetical protein IE077_003149 [Cardiosporidium cionae]|uniref:Uncharacterized protein n=1 Tax=Cardiosporidium cionae TaxID=476202 RepID=A0ABQ7JF95_9APIC|nr:hypothetical protein IE077_003149 [Cardiosporidium cionae]|eukprot:KAF8822680.1 hypothetical protein IE077_003149 [Cardiosporidium cionae]
MPKHSYQNILKKMVLDQRRTNKLRAGAQCQKCYQRGHWTFECKNSQVYLVRPSRSQILKNPKLQPPAFDEDDIPEIPRITDGDYYRDETLRRKRQAEQSIKLSAMDAISRYINMFDHILRKEKGAKRKGKSNARSHSSSSAPHSSLSSSSQQSSNSSKSSESSTSGVSSSSSDSDKSSHAVVSSQGSHSSYSRFETSSKDSSKSNAGSASLNSSSRASLSESQPTQNKNVPSKRQVSTNRDKTSNSRKRGSTDYKPTFRKKDL